MIEQTQLFSLLSNADIAAISTFATFGLLTYYLLSRSTKVAAGGSDKPPMPLYRNVNTGIEKTKKDWLIDFSLSDVQEFFGPPEKIFQDLLDDGTLLRVDKVS